MTSCKSIIRFLFVFVLLVPGACNKPERQQKLTYPPREIRTAERNEPKLEPAGGEGKNYVPGEIMVKFVIDGSGNTTSSSIIESTVDDSLLENEVIREINSWKFMKTGKLDGITEVVYPFEFSLKNKLPE